MIKKFYLVVLFVCNGLLNNFFCFKMGAFYGELIMSFNFPTLKKVGGPWPTCQRGPWAEFWFTILSLCI